MLRKLPDDPEIENIDPIMKTWMFYSWIEDYNDEYKLLENQGYLIASFSNPQAVKKVLGQDAQTVSTTDAEFEETMKKIEEIQDKKAKEAEQILKEHKKKKRKVV